MTLVPGAWIETLKDPSTYTHAQLDQACAVANALHRGKLVLVEAPKR